MADIKNTHRTKRKYGEKRSAATSANRKRKAEAGELRVAKLLDRTQSLVSKKVAFRTEHGPMAGRVLDVMRKRDTELPKSVRSGSYLKINGEDGNIYIRPRSRVKP